MISKIIHIKTINNRRALEYKYFDDLINKQFIFWPNSSNDYSKSKRDCFLCLNNIVSKVNKNTNDDLENIINNITKVISFSTMEVADIILTIDIIKSVCKLPKNKIFNE